MCNRRKRELTRFIPWFPSRFYSALNIHRQWELSVCCFPSNFFDHLANCDTFIPILRIFDITYKDGSPSLVPGIIHSLDGYSVGNQRSPNNMTSSGRTVRRPASSDAYSRTSDNGKQIKFLCSFVSITIGYLLSR